MPDFVVLSAFAKVNYTLDVLSPRPDGYHNIASVMQTISLADTITLTRSDSGGIEIICHAPGVPGDSTNLAYRAADAAIRASDYPGGVQVRIDKRIPPQAGLGGGSSDAAATLRGVNTLLGLGVTNARLSQIAADLGSDVPFFLAGGTASVRGRGEQVKPLPDGPELWFVIVKPEAGVSTAGAYRALDAVPDRVPNRATRSMERLLAEGDVERIAARMTNDFEQAVFPRNPPVTLAHDDLLMARARNARLCGSGSAVFGVAFGEAEAAEIARLVRLKYTGVFVCRAVARAESLEIRENG